MLKKIISTILLVLTLLAGPTFIPVGEKETGGPVTIYLISNDIHTDLVLPVKNDVMDWETFWNPEDFSSRPSRWVEIGWGDKEFYQEVPTWDQFSYTIALRALLFPGEAAIHVNYVDGDPENYLFSGKLEISRETYSKLVIAIKADFKSRNEKPILIGKGYSNTDNFYEAYGSFSILRTCNVWTSDMLSAAGLRHPLWSPTKYGLEFIWH